MQRKTITILGDSRAFDTYFYNSNYDVFYGYNKTFPYILRRNILLRTNGQIDVVHIPDHFRGGSVENNILRIAMNNPDVVILCNGLWETLVSKKHFIEYANKILERHSTFSGKTLDLSYSSSILAQLFLENQLSNSPFNYREREKCIVSYFKRRRRQCIYMTLSVPDRDYLNRVHYAGNYRCIPEWDICLRAVNDSIESIAASYGINILDINQIIEKNGGPSKCLIDQWHYSTVFHEIVAEHLDSMIHEILEQMTIGEDHISHNFMVSEVIKEGTVTVYGTGQESAQWIIDHPKIHVEAVIDEDPVISSFCSIPVIDENKINTMKSRVILLLTSYENREFVETRLLRKLSYDKIIVYPDELEEINNPVSSKKFLEG